MSTNSEKEDRNESTAKPRRTQAQIKADSVSHAGGRGVWTHEKGGHKHGKQLRGNTR